MEAVAAATDTVGRERSSFQQGLKHLPTGMGPGECYGAEGESSA